MRYAYPRGESRPSSIGEAKLPGFIFAKGYGKGYVGDGVLRQTHPIGAQLACLVPHSVFLKHLEWLVVAAIGRENSIAVAAMPELQKLCPPKKKITRSRAHLARHNSS